MPVWGLPCAPCVETAFAVRIHLSHPYPIPPPSHPLLCRGREIGGRVLTVSIRCTAESSTFRRTSIVDGGSRPLAALRGVGRFIVAGRLPISGKTVGRTGGAIFLASFHIIKIWKVRVPEVSKIALTALQSAPHSSTRAYAPSLVYIWRLKLQKYRLYRS